MNKASCNTIN